MPRGDLDTARRHREWLRGLPDRTGATLTRIARTVRVAASTLTRPLNEGDDGTSTLRGTTIDKIVERFGVEPPESATSAASPPRGRGFREDASPFEPDSPSDALAAAAKALAAGRNNVSPWTLKTRALELLGYLPGDVVLVDLSNTDPEPGEPVCAQIYDWPKLKAETVMRVFDRAGGVKLLLSRTLDPALQTPLQIDDERVVIKGVLLPHRLRPPAKAA